MKLSEIIKILILFSYLLVSCINKNESKYENLVSIDIPVNNSDTYYDIANDVNPDFEVIPLVGNIIGNIDKVILDNNKIFILDKLTNSIHVFDLNSKQLFTLNKRGLGPDEYVNADNFVVLNGNIWLCDNNGKRVLCYDKNFRMKESFKIDYWVWDMFCDQNHIFLANNINPAKTENYYLSSYDLQTKNLFHIKPYQSPKNIKKHIAMNKYFTTSIGETALCSFTYNDTLYEIKGGNIIPKFKYSFSERGQIEPLTSDNLNEDVIRGIKGLYETNNSVILQYIDKNRSRYTHFNKVNSISHTYKGFVNSNLGNMITPCDIINKEVLVSSLTSDVFSTPYFDDVLKDGKFKREDDRELLKSIVSTLSEDSNPVIFIFKLKDDSLL